jgi:hypothetical protein
LLPEYDNVLFSYADRTRVNPQQYPIPLAPGNGGRFGTILVDGTFQGSWRITRTRAAATLLIKPFTSLPGAAQAALAQEGRALLAFTADKPSTASETGEASTAASRHVEFLPAGTD